MPRKKKSPTIPDEREQEQDESDALMEEYLKRVDATCQRMGWQWRAQRRSRAFAFVEAWLPDEAWGGRQTTVKFLLDSTAPHNPLRLLEPDLTTFLSENSSGSAKGEREAFEDAVSIGIRAARWADLPEEPDDEPPPVDGMLPSAQRPSRKRGPSPDILDGCIQAMTDWLDRATPLRTAAESAGVSRETVLRWIPVVLKMTDPPKRGQWIKLIKAQKKDRYLGEFG